MAHVQCTCMSSQHHRTMHRNYILNNLTLQRDKWAAVLWHIESTQPRYFVHNIHASARSLARNANLTEVLTTSAGKHWTAATWAENWQTPSLRPCSLQDDDLIINSSMYVSTKVKNHTYSHNSQRNMVTWLIALYWQKNHLLLGIDTKK